MLLLVYVLAGNYFVLAGLVRLSDQLIVPTTDHDIQTQVELITNAGYLIDLNASFLVAGGLCLAISQVGNWFARRRKKDITVRVLNYQIKLGRYYRN